MEAKYKLVVTLISGVHGIFNIFEQEDISTRTAKGTQNEFNIFFTHQTDDITETALVSGLRTHT